MNTLFAAVSVGSYELEMKIFEISAKNGIKELDRIAHIIDLGRETYNYNKVSFEMVDEVCDVLYDFSMIMKSYKVKDYKAYATSAIREAVNFKSIIDRIKIRTGLDVDILSNSEQRFISYKAIAANDKNFHKTIKNGTILLDMGAGSTQVTLFDNGSLITTQNLRLGAIRIRELLARCSNNADNYQEMVEEYIQNDIETLQKIFIQDSNISHIISIGENVTNRCLTSKFEAPKEVLTGREFEKIYLELLSKSEEQIMKGMDISEEQTSMIVPNILLIKKVLDFTGAEHIWTPNVKLSDGMAVEYAEKNKLIKSGYDFGGDILSAARMIAERYLCSSGHTSFVEKAALVVFDSMKKIHGLGKRERLILQLSAILHDCGKYVSLVFPAESAYNIIMATEIIGMSHQERSMVAKIVKYNTMEFEYDSDMDMFITVSKLTAVLRIANALDRSHRQKIQELKAALEERELIITAYTYEDIALERGLLYEKADFFEEVYGVRPIIIQKSKK